jgi:ribonucleoside-diphosphate reductase alpha chain
MVEKIRKRDGSIVDFDPLKVNNAISKAFFAVRGGASQEEIDKLTEMVALEVTLAYETGVADVEGIQDIVEMCLMKAGHYDVGRAYILYRERHAQLRDAKRTETLKKIDEGRLFILNSKKVREQFSEATLRKFMSEACKGFEGVVNVEELLQSCEVSVYDGMPTEEIAQLAVLTARGLIETNPVYDTVTSRMFLSNIYKEVTGERIRPDGLKTAWEQAFKQSINHGIEMGKLAKELGAFDLEFLASKLEPRRDDLLPYRGLQTLYDRYFIFDNKEQRHTETPQMFWMRVAMGLAQNEPDRNNMAARFYEVLSKLELVSSTPTLFNSGTSHPQMSSCYLTTVEDDLDHIFKCYADNAQMSKWSGGVANDWTNLRGTGAYIKKTGVESQGIVPFLKIANDVTVAINRSGKRRGATCSYLEAWHYDIEDFIDLRRVTGDERRRTHDMDTAVWVPDLFMKRVMQDKDWTLFSSDETPDLHHIYGSAFEKRYEEYEKMREEGKIKLYKVMKAKDLYKKILVNLYETGHPWITFKDPANIRSPQDHVGVIHNSNLCTEITLNTSKEETAVCNLASVNLARHILKGTLDIKKIAETVKTGMRMLDNVIDLNYYPTIEGRTSNMRHRPVGLGIMGFQEALYQLDINFDSEKAVRFADESMEAISYYAILGSAELAKERGAYESYKGSKWDRGIFPIDTMPLLEKERGMKINVPMEGTMDWAPVKEAVAKYGMRNSNCMAIAPTATISNIAGCTPSIEPMYTAVYVKSNMSGEFTVVNRYLVEDLKKLGLWNKRTLEEIKMRDGSIQTINSIPTRIKDKYKNVFEIEPQWLIKIAAYRGKWIDQSQSLNIFTNTTSGRALSDIYMHAWLMGLKTTYYLRTLGASAVEKSTVEITRQKTKATDQQLVEAVNAKAGEAATVQIQQEMQGKLETAQAAQPVQPTLQITSDDIQEAKACKIDDPSCESCQ